MDIETALTVMQVCFGVALFVVFFLAFTNDD